MSQENLALVFTKVPDSFPVPGEHLQVKDIKFDSSNLPSNSINVEILYLSLDPYQRGRMRSSEVKSYFPAFTLNKPIENGGLAKVIKSSSPDYKEGDVISTFLPFQQYATIQLDKVQQKPQVVKDGPEDLRHWLGALGMPGLTAYSSLYEIGKPKKGETIFISSAAGAVGQIVGQLARHEGLKVIGSVGSDEKLEYLTSELNFDGGFNYKKESPKDALPRLAPEGIDIYFENVGGEHLEAAIANMKQFGRIIACGMISQYNVAPDQAYGVKNLMSVVGKRLTMRGLIVSDPDMGPKHAEEHKKNVTAYLKDGSFKAKVHEWAGMENGAEAFVGMLKGENFGKAVLKAKK